MLYTLEHAYETAVPESIRALNHFLACIVIVGQSDTSPMV